jgi:hypothetical protein
VAAAAVGASQKPRANGILLDANRLGDRFGVPACGSTIITINMLLLRYSNRDLPMMFNFYESRIAAKYLVGWLLACAVVFARLELAMAFGILVLSLLTALPLLMAAVTIVGLIKSALSRRWRRFLSILLAPPIAVCIALLIVRTGMTAEWVRFQLTRPYYLQKVAETPRSFDEPLFLAFDWGDIGGGGLVNIFDMLVYDESDEVGRPSEARSSAWRERVEKRAPVFWNTPGVAAITPFGRHFFFVRAFL